MGLSIFDEKNGVLKLLSFTIAMGTATQTWFGGQLYGVRVDNVLAVNLGGTDRTVVLYHYIGGTAYEITRLVIPANTGASAAPPIDLLALLPTLVQGGIVTEPFGEIRAAVTVAVAADGDVKLVALGGTL